jgi:hypothetical protein
MCRSDQEGDFFVPAVANTRLPPKVPPGLTLLDAVERCHAAATGKLAETRIASVRMK